MKIYKSEGLRIHGFSSPAGKYLPKSQITRDQPQSQSTPSSTYQDKTNRQPGVQPSPQQEPPPHTIPLMYPNPEIDNRELRSETLSTQLIFFFDLFGYLAPVPSENFFHHPQKVLIDAAVLDFISRLPPTEGTTTISEWASRYTSVAFRQNTSNRETLWNLGMIVNSVELTVRETQGFLRHGDARRQGQFTEEDFKRIIHVGDIFR